jgi:hypothetical protein
MLGCRFRKRERPEVVGMAVLVIVCRIEPNLPEA